MNYARLLVDMTRDANAAPFPGLWRVVVYRYGMLGAPGTPGEVKTLVLRQGLVTPLAKALVVSLEKYFSKTNEIENA